MSLRRTLLIVSLICALPHAARAWPADGAPQAAHPSSTLAGSTCQSINAGELVIGILPAAAADAQRVMTSALGVIASHRAGPPAAPIPLTPAPMASDIPRIFLLRFSERADPRWLAGLIRQVPGVAFAEPHRRIGLDFVPNDPLFDGQWALLNQLPGLEPPVADINATWAWEYSTGSESVVIAVIDSGIDAAHPDLAGCVWTHPGEVPANGIDDDGNGFVDDVHGWDFAGADAVPADDYGHGTHVSGIIAATMNNGRGMAGIAPRCRIMPLRAGDVTGLHEFAAAQAVVYAALNGAKIINASWGCYCELPAVREALVFAQARGVVCLAAAGNDGTSALHYPAAYPGVISVAATDASEKRAQFTPPYASNFGGWIDLCAPGAAVLSTLPWGRYAPRGGTSMATPMVSAVAGLVLAVFPHLPAEEIAQRLIATTDPVDIHNPLLPFQMGSGRLNALNAVRQAPRPRLSLRRIRITDANGDNRIQPGEPFQVDVLLRNDWLPCGQFQAALELPSEMAVIRTGQRDWAGFAQGEERWATPGFSAVLALDCPANRPVTGHLNLLWCSGETQRLPVWFTGRDSRPPQPGWPVSLPDKITAAPLATDLDGDGLGEVIVSCRDHRVYGFSSAGQPLAGWPATFPSGVLATPAAADVDGDGALNVCVGDDHSTLLLLDPAGQALDGWPVKTGGHGAPSSPALADLDGDGLPEVIDADWDGWVRVCNARGSALPGWPVRIAVGVNSSPALADLTADGQRDVLIAGKDGRLHLWDATGQAVPGWPIRFADGLISAPAVGDLEGDGDPEIVAVDSSGALLVIHREGQPADGWPQRLPAGTSSAPALGDLNADGALDIIIGSATGAVSAFEWDGRPLPGWPQQAGDRIDAGPLVVDADGDGQLDVVLGAGRQLYVWNQNGQSLAGWPVELDSPIRSTCAAADLDGDGDIEVIACTTNGVVHVRDLPGPGVQPSAWPCFSANPARSGALPTPRGAPVLHAIVMMPLPGTWLLLATASDPGGQPLLVQAAAPPDPAIAFIAAGKGLFALPVTPDVAGLLARGAIVWAETASGSRSPAWPYLPPAQSSNAVDPPPPARAVQALPVILGGGYGLSTFNERGGSCALMVVVVHEPDAPIANVKVLLEGRDTGLRLADDGGSGDGAADDGVYGLRFAVGAGAQVPAVPLLLEVVAVDQAGRTSNVWPSLPLPARWQQP